MTSLLYCQNLLSSKLLIGSSYLFSKVRAYDIPISFLYFVVCTFYAFCTLYSNELVRKNLSVGRFF
jgi:hypothetical protein